MDTYRGGKTVCELTIPPGYRYFVLGNIDIGADYKLGIMSAQIVQGGGSNILDPDPSVICRSTSDSGGGCTVATIVDVKDIDGWIGLNTFRYIDVEYNACGALYAIPISKL